MFKSIRAACFLFLSTGAMVLAGCGGGSSTATSMPTGSTPPVEVPVVGVSSIHLEMTDGFDSVKIPTPDGRIDAVVNRYRRSEVVCPGIPPRGNECTVRSVDIDGSVYTDSSIREDFSIDLHADFFDRMETSFPDPINGMDMFRGEIRPEIGHTFELYGGWGDHSAFYSLRYAPPQVVRTWGAAFGQLYEGKPTAAQGSATWRGAMVGHTREDGIEVMGNSLLQYDFSDDTLDLALSEIEASSRTVTRGESYTGPKRFTWSDLPQNDDGSFYIRGHGNDRAGTSLHPELGYVDGDFYGPAAEEFAGVFERDGVVGAFGGRRDE